jgi:hypothetical protein
MVSLFPGCLSDTGCLILSDGWSDGHRLTQLSADCQLHVLQSVDNIHRQQVILTGLTSVTFHVTPLLSLTTVTLLLTAIISFIFCNFHKIFASKHIFIPRVTES